MSTNLKLINNFKHFFCYQNQNGTSNKFYQRNIFITMIAFTTIIKKEQAKYIITLHMLKLKIIIHIFNKNFENTFFEGALLKLDYFLKCIF